MMPAVENLPTELKVIKVIVQISIDVSYFTLLLTIVVYFW